MALEITAVPPRQLLNRLLSEAYALNGEFGMNAPSDPPLKLFSDQFDAFIRTFETAFDQFRYALRLVIKAAKDVDGLSSNPSAGEDVEKTVRKLLHKPKGECEDARRHVAKLRRGLDALKPRLAANDQDPKVARQLETSHGYLVAYLDAARKRLDALEKVIRASQDDQPQPDAKANQELTRLQTRIRTLQDAHQTLIRVFQAQQLAANKARANRDARALSAAGDAVGKPLTVWQGLFKGSRADIEDFKKENSADKAMIAETDKLLAALNSMTNSVMEIVTWKGATRAMNLATPDYGKWLKVLKLDKSANAKRILANFEVATRDTPVDGWAKAFDKIIASFEIPKVRGSEWLSTLVRAQLVPTSN
jgi:hypothetical protein